MKKDKLQQGIAAARAAMPAEEFIAAAQTPQKQQEKRKAGRKPKPPEERKTEQVIALITKSQKKRLGRAGYAYDVADAEIVRRALEEYLERHEEEIKRLGYERFNGEDGEEE